MLIALVLGIVEGLTEFIPVSSTGHMIIVDDLLLQSEVVLGSAPVANTFKVVIQFGSIMAVVFVFWNKIRQLFRHLITNQPSEKNSKQFRMQHIIVGLLPAILLGFFLESFIDTYLFRVETVIIGLIFGAVFMLFADIIYLERKQSIPLDELTYKQALIIGIYQCLALWPGFSRSGATISSGVMLGLNYRAATDFTFLMAVPIMLGASTLSLYKKWQLITMEVVPFFIVGFFSAFIFAYLSIHFFLRIIQQIKLTPFALYRIGIAFILVIFYYVL